MIQPGTVLNNRFRIEELIGSGGMSLIYRGFDQNKRREVAIKMLREQYSGDPVFVARFRREGQAVAGLSHPNIVKIYSVCQDEDVYYLVLELVEGSDLKQVLQARAKPFEPREIHPIVAQICDAIYYAHHKKIIHRDIKPHNIIVRPDGQIKVTDFGIARAASEATVTHTGSIMGSVHYLSPEQAKGELADHRSDIYSIGVLLYEMVTGKLPFEGESPISVALQKIQQDPAPPGQANADVEVPEALEQVILKAMNRNPQRRYQTALQLKDDLREACFNNRLLYAGEPETDPQEDTLNGDYLAVGKGANGRGDGDGGQEEDMGAGDSGSTGKNSGKPGGKGGSGKSGAGRNSGSGGSGKGGAGRNGGAASSGKSGRTITINKEGQRALGRAIKITLGLLLFAALAIGGLNLGRYISDLLYSPVVDVEIPDMLGKTETVALRQLENLGLHGLVAEDRVARDNIPAGSVALQDPPATTPVRPGSTVRLTLSRGQATYPAPNLSMLTEQGAIIALSNSGLVLGNVDTINDSDTPEGHIIAQNPEADTQMKPGDKVDVVISLGPVVKLVRVQSFVGMPVSDAQEAARSLGIEFGYTSYEMSWTWAKDTIIRQTPAGETQMQEGTPIDIVVSQGPGPD
ncbi:MAG: Stk1 family PASTA domain-containing Ser/Thr kinase [Clostridiales bacterium]|nr:Stk1 family PASTA domain-containing Ser/Thr kinase [Clostridiales bacterium]